MLHCNNQQILSLALIAILALSVSCKYENRQATGGDTPITTQRLQQIRLTDIQDDLSWHFDNVTLMIENNGQSLPADLVDALLGDATTPQKIEASWQYDAANGLLLLSQLAIDGTPSGRKVQLAIAPAGHVRVNLAGRQYNRSKEEQRRQ